MNKLTKLGRCDRYTIERLTIGLLGLLGLLGVQDCLNCLLRLRGLLELQEYMNLATRWGCLHKL